MKITFDWLKDHLNTNLREEKLLEQLTNVGLEVESVENLSSDLDLFKIAKIIKIRAFIFSDINRRITVT